MKTKRAPSASLSLLLTLLAASAGATPTRTSVGSAMSALSALGQELGVDTEPAAVTPVAGAPVGAPLDDRPETEIPTVETLVNFSYGDLTERLEATRCAIYRGSGRNRRVVGHRPCPSGVTEADRISRGEVTEIVLHASLGSGACEGTVNYLLRRGVAAHFMVCRNGTTYKMVEIANIANHVKSDAVKARSIGIETESGHLFYTNAAGRQARAVTDEQVFWTEDWDPRQYWIMYASLAGVIRAVAREANIPRNLTHIRTHEEADAGENDGHTDPGGVFDGSRGHIYPEFAQRYQGENVSPFQWLMRLVTDDTPPSIVSVINGGVVTYRVRDTQNLGLSHVRVYRLTGAAPNLTRTKLTEWQAVPGVFPDAVRDVTPPTEPGDYTIIARDLVGNLTGVQILVEGAGHAGPSIALRQLDEFQLAAFEAPAAMGGGGSMPSHAFAAP